MFAQLGGLGDAEAWLERTELLIGTAGLKGKFVISLCGNLPSARGAIF